jgi:23S rRNA (adenine2503-C2)-methyltransferase
MQIIKNIEVPTGNILIVRGSKGLLECLSLADYGQANNIKADFLGFTKEINGVEHLKLMSLQEKWVCTISSQYGCSMNCSFCDVPKVGKGINCSLSDLQLQVLSVLQLHPHISSSKRLNIHVARMGEPSFNPNVLELGKWLKTHISPEFNVHPVVSTMMPRNNQWLRTFVHGWMRIKNRIFNGNAGFQISINSTSERERQLMFGGNACSLLEIYKVMEGVVCTGRKIALNFAVCGYEIDGRELLKYFDPLQYMIKLTPMHMTRSCTDNDIITVDGYDQYYPYRDVEANLRSCGYDVLVFVPSKEEDSSGITCGNAVLSNPNLCL